MKSVHRTSPKPGQKLARSRKKLPGRTVPGNQRAAEVLEMRHPSKGNATMKAVLGSTDDLFNAHVLAQISNALSSIGDFGSHEMKAAVIALTGIAPKGELEGLLAAQIVTTHFAAMKVMRLALHPAQDPAIRELYLRSYPKLVRAMTGVVDALHRGRGKGGQRVVVEHVHVHDGGQAIVGAVDAGGQKKIEEQPYVAQLSNETRKVLPMPEGKTAKLCRVRRGRKALRCARDE